MALVVAVELMVAAVMAAAERVGQEQMAVAWTAAIQSMRSTAAAPRCGGDHQNYASSTPPRAVPKQAESTGAGTH